MIINKNITTRLSWSSSTRTSPPGPRIACSAASSETGRGSLRAGELSSGVEIWQNLWGVEIWQNQVKLSPQIKACDTHRSHFSKFDSCKHWKWKISICFVVEKNGNIVCGENWQTNGKKSVQNTCNHSLYIMRSEYFLSWNCTLVKHRAIYEIAQMRTRMLLYLKEKYSYWKFSNIFFYVTK